SDLAFGRCRLCAIADLDARRVGDRVSGLRERRIDTAMAERIESSQQAGEADTEPVSAPARMRTRLARIGGKAVSQNPVLDPLLGVFRSNHPKGDVSIVCQASY